MKKKQSKLSNRETFPNPPGQFRTWADVAWLKMASSDWPRWAGAPIGQTADQACSDWLLCHPQFDVFDSAVGEMAHPSPPTRFDRAKIFLLFLLVQEG